MYDQHHRAVRIFSTAARASFSRDEDQGDSLLKLRTVALDQPGQAAAPVRIADLGRRKSPCEVPAGGIAANDLRQLNN